MCYNNNSSIVEGISRLGSSDIASIVAGKYLEQGNSFEPKHMNDL